MGSTFVSVPSAPRVRWHKASALLVAVTLLAAGCSDDEPASDGASSTTGGGATTTAPVSTTTGAPRPVGPAATLEEITVAGRAFLGESAAAESSDMSEIPTDPIELPNGYEEHEYIASGTATDYAVDGELGGDGKWTLSPGTTAEYRTRVVVRRPGDPDDSSGTVVVEWLNVSGGLDANPDWSSLEEEITRKGHVWVGVSAQLIGVAGGPVLVKAPGAEEIVGKGLMALNPERYGTLDHPGDGYAYDIYTQVARAVRAGDEAFGGTAPEVVLAAGESQSAIALSSYYNGVQPLTLAFDGFFIHSRAYAGLPFVEPGKYADLAGAMVTAPEPVLLRDDLDEPVLELQAEGDVIGILNSYVVRQPDSDTFRLWEVAGTAHADAHLLGPIAEILDCGAPVNAGAMHVVAKAGLRALDGWVRTGNAPPEAERLEVDASGEKPAVKRDDAGIALGGIRTPVVDVPVDVVVGDPPPNDALICILMGSTTPLPDAELAERYESADDYLAAFEESTDAAIEAGFALDDDRATLVAFAQPERIAG